MHMMKLLCKTFLTLVAFLSTTGITAFLIRRVDTIPTTTWLLDSLKFSASIAAFFFGCCSLIAFMFLCMYIWFE